MDILKVTLWLDIVSILHATSGVTRLALLQFVRGSSPCLLPLMISNGYKNNERVQLHLIPVAPATVHEVKFIMDVWVYYWHPWLLIDFKSIIVTWTLCMNTLSPHAWLP